MQTSLPWLIGFNAFVLAVLAIDLGVFHRKAHEIRLKEAIVWVAVWVALAMLFDLGILLGWFGTYEPAARPRAALEFLTGYLIEESLSVDNVFVFAVILSYFAVPPSYQHRVLFFGILGAVVFRGVFIFMGLWLIEKFEWMMYLFGVLLVVTGIKMGMAKDKEIEPERNPVLRLTRRVLPVTEDYRGTKFLTRIDGRLLGTPLLLVLVFIETTDIIFAADSIPAIMAISQDPFVVYTSNIFAILGLRALYFAVANFMRMFHYLHYGLAVLLVVIGCKMLAQAAWHVKLPILGSLGLVAGILGVAVVVSILWPPEAKCAPAEA
ncbi:MAG: TerC family protein [Planctomycetota bacterium]